MAVPKTMQTEFGIHYRLESCVTLKKLSACNFGCIQGRKPIIVSGGASAVVSDIKEAAFRVAKEQYLAGMAYEPSSGLYYDYKVVIQILVYKKVPRFNSKKHIVC